MAPCCPLPWLSLLPQGGYGGRTVVADDAVKDDVLGRFRVLLFLLADEFTTAGVAVAFTAGLIGGDQGRAAASAAASASSGLSSKCSSSGRCRSLAAVMLA